MPASERPSSGRDGSSRPEGTPPPAERDSDGGPERVAVGRINGTWGLKGHVKVTPLTSNPERLNAGEVLLVRGERRRILESISPQGFPMLVIEGYETTEAAASLRGTLLEIPFDDLPPLPEDEYYVHDLVGLRVRTQAGEDVGELVDVLTTGANDVYVVRRPGRKDALIPVIGDVVLEVNLAGREVVIEPLPGLLD